MIKIENKFLTNYTFIDLFAGIGGFHYALSSCGAKCVFACEWNSVAQKTYIDNFGVIPQGDITKIEAKDIPTHDILCAGFPCQAFSIAGKQKGFEDVRGTLFFDIVRIAEYHKPKILFLENVKNLISHDTGNTFSTIKNYLSNLGYNVFYQILDTSNFGLPQHRERIYIVAFRKDILHNDDFKFPTRKMNSCLNDILEKNNNDINFIERSDIQIYKDFSCYDTLFGNIHLPNRPIQIGIINKGGQGERIYHTLGHAVTLSAYGGGVGAKTGLYFIDGKIRRLTPKECARLQGFPNNFIINENINEAYKQFGNTVSIDVLQYILIEIGKIIT